MQIVIGPDVIASYRRLDYTAWHAIAEFVDNSTGSFIDNREVLERRQEATPPLKVGIVYDKDNDLLRVSDNAFGMSLSDVERALRIGVRPPTAASRSKYGMGLKTAACWLGNHVSVRSAQLGSGSEYSFALDIAAIAGGNVEIAVSTATVAREAHYTIIEVSQLQRVFKGRTLGKIRDFLRSMYRSDLADGWLELRWNDERLEWDGFEDKLWVAVDGSMYKRDLNFDVGGKVVRGWVGILDHGSRAQAGFAQFHSGRVVRGWPDAWRPGPIFGQLQGSNDLINQRLVGEFHLDDFEVSHTKDAIQWLGDEEEQVEERLAALCSDYRDLAKKPRKRGNDERGPTEAETRAAVEELLRELQSAELADTVRLETVPEPSTLAATREAIAKAEGRRTPAFRVSLDGIEVSVFIATDRSPNDPYLITDSPVRERLLVIVNRSHIHWTFLSGAEGVLNFLRHCVYDGLAEHIARFRASRIDPDTIKHLKDKYLRVRFEIELHASEPGATE